MCVCVWEREREMNKSDTKNRNITFKLFIFLLFSTSFDLKLSSRENVLMRKKKVFSLRKFLCCWRSIRQHSSLDQWICNTNSKIDWLRERGRERERKKVERTFAGTGTWKNRIGERIESVKTKVISFAFLSFFPPSFFTFCFVFFWFFLFFFRFTQNKVKLTTATATTTEKGYDDMQMIWFICLMTYQRSWFICSRNKDGGRR